MKITIIYDNESCEEDIKSDWGFSCFAEMENIPGILFDTGASGSILLSNMKNLNIEPNSISKVFISHKSY